MNTWADSDRTEMLSGDAGSRRVFVLVLPIARLLLGTLAVCAIVAAGAAGYWLATGNIPFEGLRGAPALQQRQQSVLDVPEMVVNLRRDTPSRYLKIGLSLSIAPERHDQVEQAMPRLVDALQEFLRNLDQDDLQGSPGLHRLRTEVKRRFNLILATPNSSQDVVTDVLLRSLLTQ